MKANELRIGNWVKYLDEYKGLRPDRLGKQILITADDINFLWEAEPEYIEPIPLTEEWLLKFGFEKHHQSFYDKTLCVQEVEYLWFYNIYPLENSIIPLVNMSAQATGHYIKYVHQLQNLYFALTGEELKTIKR